MRSSSVSSSAVQALTDHLDSAYVASRQVGKVHVDEDALGPSTLDQHGQEAPCPLLGGRPMMLAVVPVCLAERDGRRAEQRRLHRRSDGAGIGHVLAHVGAVVDAGEHQIGRVVDQDLVEGEENAVGGRAVDGVAAPGNAAEAQRTVQRERMGGCALLGLGRHHPHVLGEAARHALQHLDAGRVDAVVVANEDAHQPMVSMPPR